MKLIYKTANSWLKIVFLILTIVFIITRNWIAYLKQPSQLSSLHVDPEHPESTPLSPKLVIMTMITLVRDMVIIIVTIVLMVMVVVLLEVIEMGMIKHINPPNNCKNKYSIHCAANILLLFQHVVLEKELDIWMNNRTRHLYTFYKYSILVVH